jgi:hypothetical protein
LRHGGVIFGIDSDADTGASVEQNASRYDRLGQFTQEAPQCLVEPRFALEARDDDGELIAPKSRDKTAAADYLAEPPRSFDEQRVSDIVTVRVIDLLEAVQIEQQKGDLRVTSDIQLRFKLLSKVEPIAEAGERVMRRQPA